MDGTWKRRLEKWVGYWLGKHLGYWLLIDSSVYFRFGLIVFKIFVCWENRLSNMDSNQAKWYKVFRKNVESFHAFDPKPFDDSSYMWGLTLEQKHLLFVSVKNVRTPCKILCPTDGYDSPQERISEQMSYMQHGNVVVAPIMNSIASAIAGPI